MAMISATSSSGVGTVTGATITGALAGALTIGAGTGVGVGAGLTTGVTAGFTIGLVAGCTVFRAGFFTGTGTEGTEGLVFADRILAIDGGRGVSSLAKAAAGFCAGNL